MTATAPPASGGAQAESRTPFHAGRSGPGSHAAAGRRGWHGCHTPCRHAPWRVGCAAVRWACGSVGMSSMTASNMVVSLTLAAVTAAVSGSPLASQTRWSLLPGSEDKDQDRGACRAPQTKPDPPGPNPEKDGQQDDRTFQHCLPGLGHDLTPSRRPHALPSIPCSRSKQREAPPDAWGTTSSGSRFGPAVAPVEALVHALVWLARPAPVTLVTVWAQGACVPGRKQDRRTKEPSGEESRW